MSDIDPRVNSFIQKVGTKFNIDKAKLVEIWKNTKEKNLNKLKKTDLVALCKKYNLKTTGKKSVLIERINKRDKLGKLVQKGKPVSVIQIRKNTFGNYEHLETGFIFNKQEQKVIGVQNKDGTVQTLTKADLELCNKFKFTYDLPEILDEVNVEEEVEELDENEFSEEEYFSEEA